MNPFKISIITCTFNPDLNIIKKCIEAIISSDKEKIEIEYVIVDNNSSIEINSSQEIRKITDKNAWIKIVKEKQPGISFARICGITHTSYENILFIDDDVVIAKDFFTTLESLIKEKPFIGAWNPGIIEVKFAENHNNWFAINGAKYFQESKLKSTVWSNEPLSGNSMPFGTGLYVKREVANLFVNKIKNKKFTLTGRRGNLSLACEDTQLILCAIELGFGVGRSCELKVVHLIRKEKTNFSYLLKIFYYLGYSQQYLFNESLPDRYQDLTSGTKNFKGIIKLLLAYKLRIKKIEFKLELLRKLGTFVADYEINKKRTPFWITKVKKLLLNEKLS